MKIQKASSNHQGHRRVMIQWRMTEKTRTHGAVQVLDGLDRRLVVLEVYKAEAAALAFGAFLLRLLAFEHLDLAAEATEKTSKNQGKKSPG